jgi:phenylacetic acid degradation operon negative regulatory protein
MLRGPAVPGARSGYVAPVTASPGTHRAAGPRPAQPRALIVTIYGLYARESGGWMSVAALIRLMAELGVDEPAVRSSISRLKRRGILVPQRGPGAARSMAGYALSGHGRQVLAEGDRRIFGRQRARISEGWLLAIYSVPEPQRQRRHELRARLAWLGFGTVSPGVWIAPAQLAAETAGVLRRYELAGYVDLFRAEYLAFGELAGQAGRWWDLDRLQDLYRAFLVMAEPVLARAARGGQPGAAAFADYVSVLTAWRRLPYLDPGLPAELLPDGWAGTRAAEVFERLRGLLAGPAHAYVTTVTGALG